MQWEYVNSQMCNINILYVYVFTLVYTYDIVIDESYLISLYPVSLLCVGDVCDDQKGIIVT